MIHKQEIGLSKLRHELKLIEEGWKSVYFFLTHCSPLWQFLHNSCTHTATLKSKCFVLEIEMFVG